MEQTHKIHRHNYENQYTIFSNHLWENPQLCWGAKALLAYMLSRPANWSVYRSQLASIYKGEKRGNGKNAVDSFFNELMEHGYIVYTPKDEKTGRFIHRYDVYPEPVEDFQKKIPKQVKPAMDQTENGLTTPQTNNNSSTSNERDNNPDGLEAPSAVVVSSQNEDLEKLNLSESLKKKIIKSHPPEKIKEAVNRVLAWEGRYGDAVAIQTVFRDWDKWGKVETKEGYEEKNMRILHKLRKHQGERKNFCVWVCDKYFEIVHGTRGYMVQVQESNFLGKLKDLFDKFGLVEDFVALESI